VTAARTAPATLADLMVQALAMERAAVSRYSALADVMQVHNNRPVEALFRKMAVIEERHAQEIMAEMGWKNDAAVPVATGDCSAPEAPESVPEDAVHYLMWPWHALQLALAAEQRAEAFFARLAQSAADDRVREAATRLRDEEREHVALVKAWLDRTPEPGTDWADDPDQPRYVD